MEVPLTEIGALEEEQVQGNQFSCGRVRSQMPIRYTSRETELEVGARTEVKASCEPW